MFKGHHPAQHPAGQRLSSAPAAPGTGFGSVKFPMPGIALAWWNPISVPSATAQHLCTAVNWSWCSQPTLAGCRLMEQQYLQSWTPQLTLSKPTTHTVACVTHGYTVMCQLRLCQMNSHVWSEGHRGKYCW